MVLKRVHLKYIYIISLCIAMITKLPGFVIPWYFRYFFCVFWIGIYLVAKMQNGNLKFDAASKRASSLLAVIFVMPYVILWLCSMGSFLFYLEDTQLNNISRGISETLQISLMLLSVISTARIFKEKLLDYTFTAVVLNYSIFIIIALMQYGLREFVTIGLLPFSEQANAWDPDGNPAQILEVHDVVFATGFVFLYYLFYEQKSPRRKKCLALSSGIMYLGYKRIQLLGILAVLPIRLLLKKCNSKRDVRKMSIVFTVCVFLAYFGFLWVIDSDILGYITTKFSINTMGRLGAYRSMAPYFEVSPLYLGRGIGAAGRISESNLALGLAQITGHSDMLYRYIDAGFFGFSAWIIFCIFTATDKISHRLGTESSKIWLIFTIYAFVTYLTDNTTLYFSFQTVYMVIMYHIIYSQFAKRKVYLKG